MIILIPGARKAAHFGLIDQMHRLRKAVFHDHLKWQVNVARNWEIDHYDAMDPLYVLSVNENNEVLGCLRLLPTTGLNMLNDTFSELLPDGAPIESPLIWESSRFTIRNPLSRTDFAKIGAATAELGLALNEIGKAAGLSHIVTVYDAHMHRLLQRTGCAGDPISEPKVIGGVLTYAVTYEVGDFWSDRVTARTGAQPVNLDATILRSFRTNLAA